MKIYSTSKSVYFLMEVMLVILLFALSSMVCIQVHVQAVNMQKEADATRFAMQQATSILEGIKTGLYPSQCNAYQDCTWEVLENGHTYSFSLTSVQEEQGMLMIRQGEQEYLQLPFTWNVEVVK